MKSVFDVRCWAFGVGCLLLFSCAHVIAPKSNVPTQASYDGNARNSGIIAVAPGGGRIVTPHFRDRYNGLIDLYYDQFIPPLKHDVGIEVWTRVSDTVTEYKIDKEHFLKAGQMIQFKRDGRKPTGVVTRLLRKI